MKLYVTILALLLGSVQLSAMEMEPETTRESASADEQKSQNTIWGLPVDMHNEIIIKLLESLKSYDSLDEKLQSIGRLRAVNKEFNQLFDSVPIIVKELGLDALTQEDKDNRLIEAAEKGQLGLVRLLIHLGADINPQEDEDGYTALHCAALKGHVDVAELLIKAGAEKNAKDKFGYTALHCAAVFGHVDVAKLLIAKGADINAKDKYGDTALYCAARNGHRHVAKLLIENGADVTIQDLIGETALHGAALFGHVDVAKLLIAKGADINAQRSDGDTALDLAVRYDRKGVVELLMAQLPFYKRMQYWAWANPKKVATVAMVGTGLLYAGLRYFSSTDISLAKV